MSSDAAHQPTVPLPELFPGSGDAGSAGVPDGQQPARKKSRWGRRLTIVLVVLALLLGIGAVIAEFTLRQTVPEVMESAARKQLSLSADHEVEATVGGTSVLWQTLTGGYRDVTLRVPDAPLGDLRGEISLRAYRVPLNPTTGPLTAATGSVTLTPEQLQPLLSSATVGLAGEVSLEDGEMQIKSSIPLFGAQVPLELGVTLAASPEGNVLITPSRAKAGGLEITSEQLSEGPAQMLAPLLEPREVCILDRLPVGLTLTDIDITSSGKAVASFAADPKIVLDAAMREKGTCGK
ncbi:LmeA family phospholipid-binding protein [Leucobacter sp. M11]|uniref:LmeA family phospholipid-binding protein n=1 Tax=Leucobacter sp. M11 TaxID=2993565 RepID=UPI002D7F14FD|nr:DUF2993 domain-containing protein [Leucobacter sp. M11]MEB4615611.1 DUF2993 domain-containing protein [Leucobacter sp. M11]